MRSERDKDLEELFSPLEELTSSDEETRKLRDLASGLFSMEKADFSSSFRDNLRDSLLQKMRRQQAANASRHKIFGNWLNRFYQGLMRPATNQFRPVFALAAATVLIVTVMTVSSNPQESIPRFRAVDHRNSTVPYIMAEGSTGTEEKVLPEEQPDSQTPAENPPWKREAPESPATSPRICRQTILNNREIIQVQANHREQRARQKKGVLNENESPRQMTTRANALCRKSRSFKLKRKWEIFALQERLSFHPFILVMGEENSPYEDVSANFIPNKYAFSTIENDEAVFGSNAWAANLLKNRVSRLKARTAWRSRPKKRSRAVLPKSFTSPAGREAGILFWFSTPESRGKF